MAVELSRKSLKNGQSYNNITQLEEKDNTLSLKNV